MLDTRDGPGSVKEYTDNLLSLAEVVLSGPRHFFRTCSASELGRFMTSSRRVPAP
ncbi:hypothetical protein [Actinacidiphila yeochonensis]|uniref:hypothetical protein n=1 Tax=Actinacidiphila yeochonensis TaxID=89050 RepID=UPI000B0E87DF|nr:hypothetical protein [Actinacidiphila yeochonensis]